MMTVIMRTIIDLPDEHLDALARLCEREGISRAEAIRRAVQDYTRGQGAEVGESAFGLWRGRKVGGLAYERDLRNEW